MVDHVGTPTEPITCCHARSSIVAALGVAAILLVGTGCGQPAVSMPAGNDAPPASNGPDGPSASPTQFRCPPSHGPPTWEVIRCRLLESSAQGAYPRQVSEDDADVVVAALERLSEAMRTYRGGEITESAFEQVLAAANADCESRTGLTCDVLLFAPRSQ